MTRPSPTWTVLRALWRSREPGAPGADVETPGEIAEGILRVVRTLALTPDEETTVWASLLPAERNVLARVADEAWRRGASFALRRFQGVETC